MAERLAPGWPVVISTDASTTGIEERIRQAVVHARDLYQETGEADLDRGRSGGWSGISLGPLSLQRTVFKEMRPNWDARHLLTALRRSASSAGVAVLLTVDEVHSGDRSELRRLSGDLQHMTKRARIPVAFLGAGLSEIRHTLLMDKKMTFLRRCSRMTMSALTTADAVAGLRLPILDAGGRIDPEALRLAADACGPLPYKLQLIGHNAWNIAGAPRRAVDLPAVREAIRLAELSFADDLVVPAWRELSASERAFLGVVAKSGGEAGHQEIAGRLTARPQALADTEDRLRACQYISDGALGKVALTELMPLDVVRGMVDAARRYDAHTTPADSESTGVALASPGRCDEYMPRAKAKCVLPSGHRGGHRSGRRRRTQH